MNTPYLEPTEQAARALFTRGIQGPVVMLNLLRFKETADYSQHPELAPASAISGREAYEKYIEHTRPFLAESGGELLFTGDASAFFIGPSDEQWDMVMLVKQQSLNHFMQFATNPGYQAGLGHRTAALADSRLLPVVEKV